MQINIYGSISISLQNPFQEPRLRLASLPSLSQKHQHQCSILNHIRQINESIECDPAPSIFVKYKMQRCLSLFTSSKINDLHPVLFFFS